MMLVLDPFIMVQLAICMFLGLINLVTKHLFTCLKPDPILLQSQKLHIYMMVSNSDSNYRIHSIIYLIMITYQFNANNSLYKCLGRNSKYKQYLKFKAMVIIYFKSQALCDIDNIGSTVNVFFHCNQDSALISLESNKLE